MEKILLVDDHSIIRSGLRMTLKEEFNSYDFEEASTADDCLSFVMQNEYALIILDINIPGTDTLQVVHTILQQRPEAKILMFSMNAENLYAKRFLKAGAKGYVRKDEPADKIKLAVSTVISNKRYISEALGECLANDLVKNMPDNPFEKLSPKQVQIVQLLIKGQSIGEICESLNLHNSTVSTQKLRIYEKLSITNVVDLYALAKLHVSFLN